MANFANEGGIEYHFRYLENIMGMWLLQNIRRNINKELTYDEMMYTALSSKDKYLNKLTSEYTSKKVFTGLMEATATGNLLLQIMYDKNTTLAEARKIIKRTFDVKEAD